MLNNNWKLVDRPELGAMNSANRIIRQLDFTDMDALPSFRTAETILIGSDYSGQHSTSQLEAFAFVLSDMNRLTPWLAARSEFRRRHLSDGRRMSYKALSDRQRSDALPEFLRAANLISGILVVVLVDKKIDSLFKSHGKIKATDREIVSLSHWPPHVVEKSLRICHFIALFLAGLSGELQNVLWITDQDEVVANVDRHREFVSTFGTIISHYLAHNLGHVRVATTESDTGKRDLEDFVAIADIAAGAVCEALSAYVRIGQRPIPGRQLPIPDGIGDKALGLMHWFSDSGTSLKRIVLSFEGIESSNKIHVRHYAFDGSNRVA